MKTRTLALAAPLLAVAGLAAPASAAVMQAPGANFVAFEAENFDVEDGADTAEPFWQTIADPNASGGQTLFANDPGDFTNGQPGNNEFVGYTITFTQTGDYQLYVSPAGRARREQQLLRRRRRSPRLADVGQLPAVRQHRHRPELRLPQRPGRQPRQRQVLRRHGRADGHVLRQAGASRTTASTASCSAGTPT